MNADGPWGSGRFWRITVGLAADHSARPDRGFCLTTSTLGWRTLQRFQGKPLPWVEDLEGDGKPEMIFWASFPLRQEPMSLVDYGLIAWVYRVTFVDAFTIDWRATRNMASRIATAYREPIGETDSRVLLMRNKASDALMKIASGQCDFRGEPDGVDKF